LIEFESEQSIKKKDKGSPKVSPIKIKALGIGGAGCSIISRVCSQKWSNINFTVCDSSVKTLAECGNIEKILLGESLTRGWGTGGNREVGRRVAEEAENEIRDILKGVDLLFLVCALGKGLGAGASPVVLKIAKEKGLVSIGFFILPFNFEGKASVAASEEALNDLWQLVDGAVVVSNDTLLRIGKTYSDNTSISLKEVFAKIDEILGTLLQSIENILYNPGVIGLDFADLKSFLARGRQIMITTGKGTGERCVEEATEEMLYSPFWGEIPLKKAKGTLLSIWAGEEFKLSQLEKIILSLREKTSPHTPINFGVYLDESLSDKLVLTLLTSNATDSDLRFGKTSRKKSELGDYNQQDLDIPTFLRKQFNTA